MKKVLIAAPIGSIREDSMTEWLEWIANQTYPEFDFCLCANGKDRIELFKKAQQTKVFNNWHWKKCIPLLLVNSGDLTMVQKVHYAREKIRLYAVSNGYDAIFWMDTDTIPMKPDAIEQLMSWNEESVSGVYFYKESKVPVALDKNTFTNFTLDVLEKAFSENKLIESFGHGYGCLLHTGKAIHEPFVYIGEHLSEDFGHCDALRKRGVRLWVYPKIVSRHLGKSGTQIEKTMLGLKQ